MTCAGTAYRVHMPQLPADARIDLHTHSTFSDGSDSPTVVVQEAARVGLDVVALTDHDVVDGWSEADRAGHAVGVVVVPGIEVSCSWSRTSVHLLAYLPDPHDPALGAELERVRDSRVTRIQHMVGLLAADGYPVTYAEVLEHAGDEATLGRPHVADVLVAHGRYRSRGEAFADVLASSSPYYVTHHAPDPVAAVELVVAAGGAPVMAHPFASSRGRVVSEDVIEHMTDAGMVGLEVDHRDHDRGERERAAALARRLGLLATGSSDYHGSGKPNRLGECTTSPQVLEELLQHARGHRLLGASP